MQKSVIVLAMVLSMSTACSHDPGPQTGDSGETSSGSTGSETSTTAISSTDTGGSETSSEDCNAAAVVCQDEAAEQFHNCRDGCNYPLRDCEDEKCEWSCLAALEEQQLACAEIYCPTGVEPLPCEADCHAQAAACTNEQSCDFIACTLVEVQCMMSTCHPCEWLELVIPYTGSCEIMLPGSSPSAKPVEIEIGPSNPLVVPPEYTCDMPDVFARWTDNNYDTIELCGPTCDTFSQAGELVLAFASPPCE